MIEQMQFITLTGPKSDIDRVVQTYLTSYEIHMEQAMSATNNTDTLTPLIEANPYDALQHKAQHLSSFFDTTTKPVHPLPMNEACTIIETYEAQVNNLSDKIVSLHEEIEQQQKRLQHIEPFLHIHVHLKTILQFHFLKFRFGRFPKVYYEKFKHYIYNYLTTVFYECQITKDYVYGIYFTCKANHDQIDSVYHAMHFERIFIPDDYDGTPKEAYKEIETNIRHRNNQIKTIKKEIKTTLFHHQFDIQCAATTIEHYAKNFNIRTFAACTKNRLDATDGVAILSSNTNTFYVVCGFIRAQDVKKLEKDISTDANVILLDDNEQTTIKTPTKLVNPKIFRPFELFIQMYGIPSYNEIDPTKFVALTYSFMFGMMFGDVGQGLLLVLFGYLIYKIKHLPLAGIICFAGVFSTFFGFMYGSCFGFEDLSWLPAIWLHPMHNVMTILIIAVGFGACLILFAMILNIINGIKTKDIKRTILDQSGLMGFLFYGITLFFIYNYFKTNVMPKKLLLTLCLGLPLLFIFFREPISHSLEHKKELFPDNKFMYFLEGIVELFEILLSYITNTISFVRVGAFALSHAGMMGVVLSLAKVESNQANYLVLILGNLLVVGLEGLVVGIQVLRLEYYEMFSRFYRGNGKEFKPF